MTSLKIPSNKLLTHIRWLFLINFYTSIQQYASVDTSCQGACKKKLCWVVIENKASSIEAVFAENGNSRLSANNQTGSVDYMRMKANVINLDYILLIITWALKLNLRWRRIVYSSVCSIKRFCWGSMTFLIVKKCEKNIVTRFSRLSKYLHWNYQVSLGSFFEFLPFWLFNLNALIIVIFL